MNVAKVQLEDGKTISASQYGQNVELVSIGDLTAAEHDMLDKVKVLLTYLLTYLLVL